ncbi:SAM-dependent methyltransferase [Streptomyces sp. CB02923]|uniref:class I SAM-dependent methyltransferase n=1 Tax=Streptomyces sp. CB02923 TaxID=1718985 RepID=UPI00093D1320|nr:class I SAM-dependent methyltransferase [Streptomyces sp. CB02923]OKI00800.1 SAM-dependent methyltransferase [Streptomyces sp. CB02923]
MTDHNHGTTAPERGHDHGNGPGHDHGSGQGHDHHHDSAHMDWEDLADHLEGEAEFQTPLLEQATAWLRDLLTEPSGPGPDAVRRVLDVGSGPGVTTCLLAHAFPQAEIVAVDPTEALLERARDRAARLGLGDRFRTHVAELPDGIDGIGDADLIWSSKALHHVGDQAAAVAALARRLRPGGLLVVSEGGLTSRMLPRDFGIGRPGLQARLDVLLEDWFAEMRAALPGTRGLVEDWPAILTSAGLRSPLSRSFLLDLPAPLNTSQRAQVTRQLSRFAQMSGEILDEEDRATLDRLLTPDDPAGIARRPDLFWLSAQTFHTARAS